MQDWCRGFKRWSAESFCSDCHAWSWRSYADPDWLSGEDAQRLAWDKFSVDNVRFDVAERAKLPK